MIETKFEVGRRYRALGGWIGTVTKISKWDGRLSVAHNRLDMSGKFQLRTSNLPDGRFNYEGGEGEHENDLLLPAIGPEGAGFSGPPAKFTLEHTGWQENQSIVGAGIELVSTEANSRIVIVAPNLDALERYLARHTDVEIDRSKLRTVGVYDRGEIDSLLEGGPAK